MKNLIFTILLSVSFHISVHAQVPEHYYDSTANKTGFELKTALFNIIKNPKVVSYASLWKDFEKTDVKNDTILDMYSLPSLKGYMNPYFYKYDSIQCGQNKKAGDCYNREHSFPASWFGGKKKPMYTDLFHIYPADGFVNSKRRDYPYGHANKLELYRSQNGSLLAYSATDSIFGKQLIVFEPIDEYKGDFARTYFYMATCYQDKIADWKQNGNARYVLAGNDSTVYQKWYVQLLLKWNREDPVSQKEITRNNAVYRIQENRNPFIDSVDFVNRIWENQ